MYNYIKLFRLSHWIKNSFVFVPLIFVKQLFNPEYFITVLLATITFGIGASIVYVINDIVDIEADRSHPKKQMRPLPSGKISINSAKISAVILGVILILLCTIFNLQFNLILAGYISLNILYSFFFKNIVIVDLFSISLGFLLRVVGGAVVIGVEVSSWLVLTTLFISLFLAVMKRRSELEHLVGKESTRKVLGDYTMPFIDQISSITAAGVILSYALYSVSEHTLQHFHTENLVYTTIFVIFGIFRYMFLVYKKQKGENTVEILLTDIPLIINIFLYILTITLIIYL